MGYTHYFTLNSEEKPSMREWKAIVEKASAIYEEHEDILCLESDQSNTLRFNGKGDDSHETFWLDRDGDGFNFCKTARKPYDIAVFKVLKMVKEACPKWITLGSDAMDGEKAFLMSPEEYLNKELCY